MRANTHKARLLDYLKQFGSITTLEAFRDLGNTRLAATVFHLRKELKENGETIDVRYKDVPTRFKNLDGTTKTTQVAEYFIIDYKPFDPLKELDDIINLTFGHNA